MKDKIDNSIKEETFEENFNRLEEIVRKLGESGTTLEEAIKLYEEGIEHHKICQEKLENAKQKIETLTRSNDAILNDEDFSETKNKYEPF